MAFHWVKLRTFVHATESRERVEVALLFVWGSDAVVSVTETKGYYGNPILILDAELTGKKEINWFFRRLLDAGLLLINDVEKIMDNSCVLHLRFDKQAAFNGFLEVPARGDIITLQAKVVAHPAKKKNAVENLKRYFSALA